MRSTPSSPPSSASALQPRAGDLRPVPRRRRRGHRLRPCAAVSGAALLHRRDRARAAGPRRAGGHADAPAARARRRRRSRPAAGRPGEFTERAFLNDKMDLAQAEAVSDLIEASTEQAARSATRSLQGVFSAQIGDRWRSTAVAADAGRGDPGLSRRGDRVPRERQRARPAGADRGAAAEGAGHGPAGSAAAPGPQRRAGRRAQRRQVEPAECAGRRGGRDRHADRRHHARPRHAGDRHRAACR